MELETGTMHKKKQEKEEEEEYNMHTLRRGCQTAGRVKLMEKYIQIGLALIALACQLVGYSWQLPG